VTTEDWRRISTIFHEARGKQGPARHQYLAEACGSDVALRGEVDKLLAADGDAGSFGERPLPIDDRVLTPGTRLGSYRIERKIGAGGMGEVFQARDLKLGRDVAIKVLPPEFLADPDRLARFQREARLLASLNHPHIGAIYGVEDTGPVRGLVLELIEGPTLDEVNASASDSRTHAGARTLPLDRALAYASQIAEALEAAHDKGIVHRDLKPSNIKIAPGGVVKVLDFGLAKAIGPGLAENAAQHDATMSRTREGVIVGTTAYMSPEQARGEAIDKRTDIWAFGCVLFELLTRRPAFDGPSAPEVVAKILERDPDWARLPADVPSPIVRLLKRCLQKDPDRRLHDIADARLEIADVLESGIRPQAAGSTRAGQRLGVLLPLLLIAAIAAAAAGYWLTTRNRDRVAVGRPVEFSINLADNTPGFGVELSPDGRRMAIGTAVAGRNQVWMHAFDGSSSGPLPGAEFGTHPFWSPDGANVAFFHFTVGTLSRTRSTGGPPTVICETPAPAYGGSWNREGDIIFSSRGKLFRVPSAGGTPAALATPGDDDPRRQRTFPQFLPDGHHFLYHSGEAAGMGAINVGSIDGGAVRWLLDSAHARYADPGYLLFLRGTALMAQRFDPVNLALDGEPALVSADVAAGYVGGLSSFSAAPTGMLAFVPARAGNKGQLVWFDRTGRPQAAIQPHGGSEFLNPAIAPAGDRVAVNRQDPQTGRWEIWVIDTERDSATRVKFGPNDARDPLWSPDGKAIAFVLRQNDKNTVVAKSLDTSGAERTLIESNEIYGPIGPSDWTRDGKYLIFQRGVGSAQEVFALPLTGGGKPIQVTHNGSRNYGGHVSPDGKWIAYSSNEAGAFDLYVERFLAPGQRTRIARGVHPRWSSDGHEVVYWEEPGGLMSVTLTFEGERFRASPPQPLVTSRILVLMDGRTHYDATADGQRFLLRQPAGTPGSSVTAIANWTARIAAQ
jgi:Tol biopolymer transport system component